MSPTQLASPERHWQAEYEFWHKLITEEVERSRFNDGLEPIDIDLYPEGERMSGSTRIGHTHFRARAFWCVNTHGKKVLRLQIRSEKPL